MAEEKEFECITCSQLVTRMAAKQMRMSRADIKMAVRVALEHMSDVLSRGQRIEVRGFGSFSLRFRKPRMTRNPKTRKTVFISGRSLPCFKPSALLLDRVNKRPMGYTLLDRSSQEEDRPPAGAEIVPAIEDMPHEAPAAENRPGWMDTPAGGVAQGNAGAHAGGGAQTNTGADGNADAQTNTGADGNAGAHADTGAPGAMNTGGDTAHGADEGREDAAPPPERDSGAV